MMRVKLNKQSLVLLFDGLTTRGYDIVKVAETLNLNPRTVRDWRRGKFTVPHDSFVRLAELSGIDIATLDTQELRDSWHNSAAGKKGGMAYIDKYKILGNQQTRTSGGNNSYRNRMLSDDIFTRKQVKRPTESRELAEFVGVMIGDGNITRYQCSIALDIQADKEYAIYVAALLKNLFAIEPKIQKRAKNGCVVIVASSIELTTLLVSLGLPMGHKIRGGLDIPEWIKIDKDYVKACLRGIFDTDGSIFQEVHKYRDKQYAYPRMAYVSYSEPLRESLCELLCQFGWHAHIRNERNVTIERFTDIVEYFKMIGSSNPKHLRRYALFGGVG